MRKVFITLSIILFSIVFVCPIFSGENSVKWQVGEELTYKVKWAFIRLGTMRIKVNDTLSIGNERVYHIQVFIDSNPLLFFVNHHSIFETYFSDDFRVHLFKYDEKINGVTYKANYRFNYADSLVCLELTDEKDPSNRIKRINPFSGVLLDGASLVYYARDNIHYTKTDTIQFLDEEKQGTVIINFGGPNGSVKIGAVDGSISAFYLDGIVVGKGVAGMTGYFQGWFARDQQRPPLIAKMKVFIGSVTVELEEWKMWSPIVKPNPRKARIIKIF